MFVCCFVMPWVSSSWPSKVVSLKAQAANDVGSLDEMDGKWGEVEEKWAEWD